MLKLCALTTWIALSCSLPALAETAEQTYAQWDAAIQSSPYPDVRAALRQYLQSQGISITAVDPTTRTYGRAADRDAIGQQAFSQIQTLSTQYPNGVPAGALRTAVTNIQALVLRLSNGETGRVGNFALWAQYAGADPSNQAVITAVARYWITRNIQIRNRPGNFDAGGRPNLGWHFWNGWVRAARQGAGLSNTSDPLTAATANP